MDSFYITESRNKQYTWWYFVKCARLPWPEQLIRVQSRPFTATFEARRAYASAMCWCSCVFIRGHYKLLPEVDLFKYVQFSSYKERPECCASLAELGGCGGRSCRRGWNAWLLHERFALTKIALAFDQVVPPRCPHTECNRNFFQTFVFCFWYDQENVPAVWCYFWDIKNQTRNNNDGH